jgi:glycosyltransferase involved in cell wall biosynthesis
MSVVIPAYNEERGIAATVSQAAAWLEARDRSYEIIVVDNASVDATAERLRPLLDRGRVRLLRNDVNRGKGFSVKRGMLDARGTLRLHCDADCTASFASLEAMLELLEAADVVVGSRLAGGARLGRRQPLARRIVGRSFVLLCRALLGEPTQDLFCGFKLWRGPAAVDVFSRVSLDGWVFDAESLAMARARGYRIREVGIHWSDREGSRLSPVRVLIPVVRELLAARANVRRRAAEAREPDRPVPVGTEPLVPEPLDPGR